MTPQSRADALLAAWQLLRLQGIAPELRLPVIDALSEIEKAKTKVRRLAVQPAHRLVEYT